MMRELFTSSLYTCGTIIAWLATLAAVRFFASYIFRRDRHVVLGGSTVTVGSPISASPTLIAAPVTTTAATLKPAPAQTEEFSVQCGSCKSPILSKPLRTEMGEGGKARLVYRCEHCGQTVGVKA